VLGRTRGSCAADATVPLEVQRILLISSQKGKMESEVEGGRFAQDQRRKMTAVVG